MKKIVIAAALAAASIAASAQVTVYGMVREFVDNTTLSGVSTTQLVNDASRFGVTAKEDLGSGLSTRVTVETSVLASDPKVGAATQLGDRQSTVGLATKDGSIDLGRNWHAYGAALRGSDPFVTYYGSIATNIHNFHGNRSGYAVFVTYKIGPVQIAFDRGVTTGPEVLTYSATGNIGPVTTSVAHFEQGADKSNIVAAQTVLLNTTLLASYSVDDGITSNTRGTLVSIMRGIDNTRMSIRAGYGVKTGLATGDVRAFNAAADYSLSKRTVASLIYRNVTDVADTKQIGLGLTHSF